MTSERERANLYRRLEEVLGEQPAATLIQMLPPRDDLATRAELAAEMADLKAELRSDMSTLKDDLRGEIAETRVHFDTALRSFVRNFVVTQAAATVVGVAGIVFGIVRLT